MKYLSLLLLFFAAFHLNAQTTINGIVVDENQEGLLSASVISLIATDSSIHSFAISDEAGKFKLILDEPGQYILSISFLGYKTHKHAINYDTNFPKSKDLGIIVMEKDIETLRETVVTEARVSVQMKKDTLVYDARAFRTEENDKVEDLLKKLPGVEVDDEGNITAQGEEVKKVLVEGKEFFGDDPKMATKNLPAKAVENVQIFDKKSERAERTGVDDGNSEKTINLDLKKEYEQGYFGNVKGGYGTEKRYEGKLNLYRYGKKTQFALLGQANNINEQGFSFNDYVNFTGGANLFRRNGSFSPSIPISWGPSNGFSDTYAGGFNFNVELGKKLELKSNYFFSEVDKQTQKSSQRAYFNEQEGLLSNTESDENSKNSSHTVNLNLEWDIDSTQGLEFQNKIVVGEGYSNELENTTNTIPDIYTNISNSNSIVNNNSLSYSGFMTYDKRMRRAGRSLILEGTLGYSEFDKKTDLLTSNFIQEELNEIDQEQKFKNHDLSYDVSALWTEPLAEEWYLGLLARRYGNTGTDVNDVYDTDSSTMNVFNPYLSFDYDRSTFENEFNGALRFIKEKSNFQAGLSYMNTGIKGNIINLSSEIDKQYNYFLPEFNWEHRPERGRRTSLNYRTSINLPSMTQLSPVVDNTDPLYIYQGNVKLLPEYQHSVRFRWSKFSAFNSSHIMFRASFERTNNKIKNAVTLDENLIQYTQPQNTKGQSQYSLSSNYNTPIRKLKLRTSISLGASYTQGYNSINTEFIKTNEIVPRFRLKLENLKKKDWDWYVEYIWNYNKTNFVSLSDQNTEYNNQQMRLFLAKTFFERLYLKTEFKYYWYGGDGRDQLEALPLWNAYLDYYLFNKRLTLRVSAVDLLNRNTGNNQTINLNYIEVSETKSLGRYVLFSAIYNFQPFDSNQNGPVHIRRH